MVSIVHAAQMLYQQYLNTGDDRFFQSRESLIRDLPGALFEPPVPSGRSSSPDDYVRAA